MTVLTRRAILQEYRRVPPTHLDNRIMGIISDQLKARLDEMRERHAQTDRELLEARERCYQALDRLNAIADELIEE